MNPVENETSSEDEGVLRENSLEPELPGPSRGLESKGAIYRWFSWLVTILVPVILVLTAMRILLTPGFVQFEYHTPNFPPDPYGFSRDDRIFLAQVALNYLLNNQGISYLADLHFQDGSPLYNQRELGHMVDVKKTVKAAISVWYGSLIGMLLLGLWAWRGYWWYDFRHGLGRGGWLTVILIGAIIIFVLLGFGFFFVGFHEVFFAPGTWTFRYSDTLIRLFPERFWRDTFLTLGGLALLGGLLLAFGFRSKSS
jgi:integral membrane protein (TIGR01906 family)